MPTVSPQSRSFTKSLERIRPAFQAIADARGLPLEELINRIIAKADAYQAAAGIVIGRRQALHDEIDYIEADERLTEADKHELIKSIVW